MTLDQDLELKSLHEDAQSARGELLRAINSSWIARTNEFTEQAVIGQPLITDGKSDDELAALKRDLSNAVTRGSSRIDELFAKAVDVEQTVREAVNHPASKIRVNLAGTYPSSPPELLVSEFYGVLDNAGYNMEPLKTGKLGKSYSSESFTADDLDLKVATEIKVFEDALQALVDAKRSILETDTADAAARSERRWSGL